MKKRDYVSILTAMLFPAISACNNEKATSVENQRSIRMLLTIGSEPLSGETNDAADARVYPSREPVEDVLMDEVFDELDYGNSSGANSEPLPALGSNASSDDTSTSDNTDANNDHEFLPEDRAAQPNKNEREACAKLLGIQQEKVTVSGLKPYLNLSEDHALAIKLVGNRAVLDLSLQGAMDRRIAGLCVFVAGNQAHARISVEAHVDGLVYVGRGNKSKGDIRVSDSGSSGALAADLSGHQATLRLHGPGDYPCVDVRLRGHQANFTCD